MMQSTSQKPSEQLKIEAWCQRNYGHDGFWTALQLDRAVLWFGSYVESKLMEIDERTKKPRYKLEDFMNKKPKKAPAKLKDSELMAQLAQLGNLGGGLSIR